MPGTAKGLCSAHYNRLRRHGSLELPQRPAPVRTLECEYPGCTKPQRGRGYCATHWKRLHAHGDVETVKRAPGWTPAEDEKLLDLPVDRRGAVLCGYLTDLAMHLCRTVAGARSRLHKLRRRRWARMREAALRRLE